MGYKLMRSKPIVVKANEEKDLKYKLKYENRGVIHGVIVDPENNPVEDALVKLFQKNDCGEKLIPIGFQFTDKYGQFLFPVEAEIEHILLVFYLEKETRLCTIIDDLNVEMCE